MRRSFRIAATVLVTSAAVALQTSSASAIDASAFARDLSLAELSPA